MKKNYVAVIVLRLTEKTLRKNAKSNEWPPYCNGIFHHRKIPEYRISVRITCTAKIAGIPYRNSFFLVLWWNTCIPIHAPTEPPMHANPRRVFSLVRHSSFFAFHLSWPNARNVMILITQR